MMDDSGTLHNTMLDAAFRNKKSIDYRNYHKSLEPIWCPFLPIHVCVALSRFSSEIDIIGAAHADNGAKEGSAEKALDALVANGFIDKNAASISQAYEVIGRSRSWSESRSELSISDELASISLKGAVKDAVVSIGIASANFSFSAFDSSATARGGVADDIAGAIVGGTVGGVAGAVIFAGGFSAFA